MSQQRAAAAPKGPAANRPVFTVAPPNTVDILESIKLIGAATAQYYQALLDGGVPPETARELTVQFVRALPDM